MCFSANMSFSVATSLAIVGGLTTYKAHPKLRPIAFVPFIFSLQQALEGIVWMTLAHSHVSSFIHQAAVSGYIFIAGIFWPFWIPGSLLCVESNKLAKRYLLGLMWVGGIVSLWCASSYLMLGRQVQIINQHLSYPYIKNTYGSLPTSIFTSLDMTIMILYMLLAIISPFISSLKHMWILGLMIGIAWLIAVVNYYMSYASVWCFFAAIASVALYFIVRTNSRLLNQ